MQKDNNRDLSKILSMFNLKGLSFEIKPFGTGHINSTFSVRADGASTPDYLLQQINDNVFKDVPGLIRNIKLVTSHLHQKLSQIPGANPDKEVLTLIPAKDGEYFYRYADGSYWRVYKFLANTKTYDQLETVKQANEGGKAFGKFQSLLSDFDSSLLIETIKDFHNIEFRLTQFTEALQDDIQSRVNECRAEIDFIKARAEKMKTILQLGREGKLPLRITHNDTKFSNILLDMDDKVQCVIDLDTVMPGYVAYDFGDAIRTIINSAAEDEKNVSKISLNMDLFKAYTEGYLEESTSFLTETELESLTHSVFLFPYMQAARFLTDHINGDTYYKIHFEGHNLQRARAQIQLLKKLEESADEIKAIINEAINTAKNLS